MKYLAQCCNAFHNCSGRYGSGYCDNCSTGGVVKRCQASIKCAIVGVSLARVNEFSMIFL